MFAASHIHMPRHNRPTALRTFVTSHNFGPTRKEPFRRGVLFTAIAGILLLIGGILTWLGFNHVFGGKVSMTGPLLIALSILLLLFSMRQFLLAKKQANAARNALQIPEVGHGTVAAMVIDRDDGIGAVTVIMDTVDMDMMDTDPAWRHYNEDYAYIEHGDRTYYEDCVHNEDYAPPSYSEIADRSPSIRQRSPGDHDNEPPPPYEEVMEEGSGYTGVCTVQVQTINTNGAQFVQVDAWPPGQPVVTG